MIAGICTIDQVKPTVRSVLQKSIIPGTVPIKIGKQLNLIGKLVELHFQKVIESTPEAFHILLKFAVDVFLGFEDFIQTEAIA